MFLNIIKAIIGTSRLPFLLLVPASIFSSYASILYDDKGANISLVNLAIVFIAALCAHIAVNMLNEYFDFKSGLDFITTKTPFSGGTGTLQKLPRYSFAVLVSSLFCTLVVIGSGIYLMSFRGITLLPFLLFGLLLVLLYTPVLVKFPFLCFFAPGLGFGIIMVNGSYTALTGLFSLTSLLLSIIVAFLVSNILLLNQFPDVEPDKKFNRKTFPVKYGKKYGALLFLLSIISVFAVLVISIILKIFPFSSSIAIIPTFLGIWVGLRVIKNPDSSKIVNSLLGLNVAVALVTPILISGCLVFSACCR